MTAITGQPGASACRGYEKGTFIRKRGDWDELRPDGFVCRKITFSNTNEHSLIHKFSLSESLNGGLTLEVYFSPPIVDVANHLKARNLTHIQHYFDGRIITTDVAEIQRLFSIIIENDQLPEEFISKVKPVIEKGFDDSPELASFRKKHDLSPGQVYIPFSSVAKSDVAPCSEDRSEKSEKALSYPGERGTFIHESGNWDKLRSSGGFVCREITFSSTNEHSLIQKISLIGYVCGAVRLNILFPRKHEEFKHYLEAHGIKLHCSDYDVGSVISSNIEKLHALFSIIIENNKVPDEALSKLMPVIGKGVDDSPELARFKEKHHCLPGQVYISPY